MVDVGLRWLGLAGRGGFDLKGRRHEFLVGSLAGSVVAGGGSMVVGGGCGGFL